MYNSYVTRLFLIYTILYSSGKGPRPFIILLSKFTSLIVTQIRQELV